MYITQNAFNASLRASQNFERAFNESRARYGVFQTIILIIAAGTKLLAIGALRFFSPGIAYVACSFGILQVVPQASDAMFTMIPCACLAIGFVCVSAYAQPRMHASGYRRLGAGGVLQVTTESTLSLQEEERLEQIEAEGGWTSRLLLNSILVLILRAFLGS